MQHPSAFGVHVHFLVHTARNRRHMLTLLSSRKNKLSFAKWSVGRVRTYTLILLILCYRSEMRLLGRHKFDHFTKFRNFDQSRIQILLKETCNRSKQGKQTSIGAPSVRNDASLNGKLEGAWRPALLRRVCWITAQTVHNDLCYAASSFFFFSQFGINRPPHLHPMSLSLTSPPSNDGATALSCSDAPSLHALCIRETRCYHLPLPLLSH